MTLAAGLRGRLLTAIVGLGMLLAACGETPLPFLPTPSPTPEQPRDVEVSVVDRSTGDPVPGAELRAQGTRVRAGRSGSATLTAMRGAAVAVTAEGFDPGRGTVPDSGPLVIRLRSNVVLGTVSAAEAPIAGATVFLEGSELVTTTDAGGRFALGGVPETGTLIVKMPGYRVAELPIDEVMTKEVALEPIEARALYAPAAVFEAPGRFDAMLALIERTEANAMVIDVKETDGRLYFATDLPEAVAVGATRDTPVFDVEQVLATLHERGIYAIARMVVMKDNTLAAARPDLGVRNTATGGPWRDNIGGAWLDPSAPGVAEYVAAVAGEVADVGFDEVQLDYIRWYSDGPFGVAATNLPNTQSFRLPSIRRVLRTVSQALKTRRAFLATDVFPIAFIVPDDQGIGQRPEVIMPYVDYFCPMVYPSHYGPGVFGHPVPNEAPYDVIDRTLEIMQRQAAGLPLVIRPWIQDFGYGSFRPYTAADIGAEMQALRDNGAQGWMIWNARAIFTEAALGPPRHDEAARPAAPAATGPAASPSPSPSASP